jgi:hypothetical protein
MLLLAYGKHDLDEALLAECVAYTGDRGAVERFLNCFTVPSTVHHEILTLDDSTMPPTIKANATA